MALSFLDFFGGGSAASLPMIGVASSILINKFSMYNYSLLFCEED